MADRYAALFAPPTDAELSRHTTTTAGDDAPVEPTDGDAESEIEDMAAFLEQLGTLAPEDMLGAITELSDTMDSLEGALDAMMQDNLVLQNSMLAMLESSKRERQTGQQQQPGGEDDEDEVSAVADGALLDGGEVVELSAVGLSQGMASVTSRFAEIEARMRDLAAVNAKLDSLGVGELELDDDDDDDDNKEVDDVESGQAQEEAATGEHEQQEVDVVEDES
jgi:hypothetical protein